MKIETQQNELDKVAVPDLRKLRELSERLHLPSKRESVIIWQKDLQELQSEGVYPIADGVKIVPKTSKSAKSDRSNANKGGYHSEATFDNTTIYEEIPSGTAHEYDTSQVISESTTSDAIKLSPEHHENVREKYFRKKSLEESVNCIRKYTMTGDNHLPVTIRVPERKSSVSDRHDLIEVALQKLRRDLLDMRIHDNALARKLLEKRQEFLEVKAVKICDQHASMIDDYSWQLEHEDDIADLLRSCDLPNSSVKSSTTILRSTSRLKLMGISRMTFDSKRFSVI